MASKHIAINTGGGDAPGLNAVIRAVTLSAVRRGWDVTGIRYGYRGLLDNEPNGLMRLDADVVRDITHLGGTILGSTNRGDPFHFPVKEGDQLVPKDVSDQLIQRFKAQGFEALVAVGGDGSVKLAKKLLDRGLPRVVAVPKTIDNDLAGTDVTFGFETAVTTATDAIDKLHSTAQSHERVMVVEVMGRTAGWIALHSGIAGSANVILLPEIPYRIESVCKQIERREKRGRRFSIVVVAEGAKPVGGEAVFQAAKDEFSEHARLGGVADKLAEQIAKRTGKDTRALVLGHLQRGGTPVTSDRLLSLRLGTAATRFLAESKESGLVSVRNGEIVLVPLEEVSGTVRTVPKDSEIIQAGRDLGMSFGDEPDSHFDA